MNGRTITTMFQNPKPLKRIPFEPIDPGAFRSEMDTLYPLPRLIFLFIYLNFACIGVYGSSSSVFATNGSVENISIPEFDTEFLFNRFESVDVDLETSITSNLSTSMTSFDLSYGSDRLTPNHELNFEFISKTRTSGRLVCLPSDVFRLITDFLTLSELRSVVCLCVSKAFTESFISALKFKNPFPYIPMKRISPLQLDSLATAAHLIQRVHPSSSSLPHLNGIESVEEIGTILTLKYLTPHIKVVNKISEETLKRFFLLFFLQRHKSNVFSSDRAVDLERMKCFIVEKNYVCSFEISCQLGIITQHDVNSETIFKNTIIRSRSVHIAEGMLKLLLKAKNNIRDRDIQDLVLGALYVDAKNVTFLKGYLNVYGDLTDYFFESLTTMATLNLEIVLELFSNPFSVAFLEKNPKLVNLVEN